MENKKRYCGNCGFFAVCYTLGERELEKECFGKCKMRRVIVGEQEGVGCVYWENTDRKIKRRKKGVLTSLDEIAEKVEQLGLLLKEQASQFLLTADEEDEEEKTE